MSSLILKGGNIFTQDPQRPRASAVAIAGNRIQAVGEDDEILALADSGTKIIGLGKRLVLPGLNDGHIHYYDWALSLLNLPLGGCSSCDELLGLISRAAAQVPPGRWLTGRGLDESAWLQPRFPSRQELDQAAGGRPVLLYRRDMHMALANSPALHLAAIDKATPDPPEGVIERGRNQEPTGVLREKAINLVGEHIPGPSHDEVLEAMAAAMPRLHSLGLTGLHDLRIMGGVCAQPAFSAWQRLDQEGRLNLRCWMCLPGDRLDEIISLGLRTGFGNDRLRVGHVKFFSDGSVGARTAWMLEPYLDAGCGMPLTPASELASLIQRAERAGLGAATHAIGDRAVRELLRALAQINKQHSPGNPLPCAPHRIEHLQMIRSEDVPKLTGLGIMASVQPMHILDDLEVMDQAMGKNGRLAYRFRDLLDAGIGLSFGSDAPVSDPNPLLGIHAAVNRRRLDGTPEGGWYAGQCLSVAEAVWSYTMGPALASGRQQDLGSILPGKLADLVVLDRDIFNIDAMEIGRAQADLTIFDGQVVFKR
jgi:predicted amidohydrolase YtcJ